MVFGQGLCEEHHFSAERVAEGDEERGAHPIHQSVLIPTTILTLFLEDRFFLLFFNLAD